LPPYDILDRILKAYIEDLRSPQEIADKYGFDLKLVRDIALFGGPQRVQNASKPPGAEKSLRGLSIWAAVPYCAAGCSVNEGTLEDQRTYVAMAVILDLVSLAIWTRARTGGAKLDGQASSSWLSSSDTVAKTVRPTCAISMPLS